MKMDVFCAWGDGPDVGINLQRTKEEAAGWLNPDTFWCLDFTAEEALALANELTAAAHAAMEMDKELAEYERSNLAPAQGAVEPSSR